MPRVGWRAENRRCSLNHESAEQGVGCTAYRGAEKKRDLLTEPKDALLSPIFCYEPWSQHLVGGLDGRQGDRFHYLLTPSDDRLENGCCRAVTDEDGRHEEPATLDVFYVHSVDFCGYLGNAGRDRAIATAATVFNRQMGMQPTSLAAKSVPADNN